MTRRLRRAAAAAALFLAALPAAARAQSAVSGRLSLVYQVNEKTQHDATLHVMLVDDRGMARELDLPPELARPYGGPRGLDRRRVTAVLGPAAAARRGAAAPVHRVLSIQPVSGVQGPRLSASAAGPQGAVQSGARPYVTLLCRFPNQASLPHEAGWYQQVLTGGSYPGLDHYWREQSDNRISLDGSQVVGWLDLPLPDTAYFGKDRATGQPDLGNPDFDKLVQDCTGVADAQVDFTRFTGVNLQFNLYMPASWGGSWPLARDGENIVSPMTWMASWAGQSVYGHEMGHSFGLPHSSGPYSATYDSNWDVMSNTYVSFNGTYGDYIGQHTIIYHKDLLGWIPASRKYVLGSLPRQSFVLERSELPPANANPLMLQVPIPYAPGEFYTVEARRLVGYDQILPGEAVVIHRVNPARADRDAQVVDPDANFNPNDAGAMWLPGETFVDARMAFGLRVDSVTATGFGVTVISGSRLTVDITGAGTVSGSGSFGTPCTASCTRDLSVGDSVTLTATPAAGKLFSGWSGACAGASCSVVMNGDRSVAALFADSLRIAGDSLRPRAQLGVPYADTLRTTGGSGSALWTITSGRLPLSLVLEASGVVSGTPRELGSFTFTAQAANGPFTATRTFTVRVDSVLQIGTAALKQAFAGVPYADTLRGSGITGAAAWTVVSGTLPAGITLAQATGVLSGTPAAAGSSALRLRLASDGRTVEKDLALNVADTVTVITPATLPAATVGLAYVDSLHATGGSGEPYTWAAEGALPPGLALGPSGVLSGTPTQSGAFTVTVRASAAVGVGRKLVTLQVNAPLAIASDAARPAAIAGVAYADSLRATGATGSYAWAVTAGALPAGLSLDGATGMVMGTPSQSGSFAFTATVTSGSSAASRAFTLDVREALSITSDAARRSGTVGVPYADTLRAAGATGSYGWVVTAGALPTGVSLDAATGVLAGTPQQAGSFAFTAMVGSGGALASRAFTLEVLPAIAITSEAARKTGVVGDTYADTLHASTGGSGAAPLWTLAGGTLPPGVTLTASGVLAGTPGQAGSFTFTARATANGGLTTATFTLTVIEPVTIVTASPRPAIVGAPYADTLAATGAVGGYAWSLAAGALPAGLSLSPGGVVSGTPTAAGSFAFTPRAVSGPSSTFRSLTLVVSPALAITSDSTRRAGVMGAPYADTLAAAGPAGVTWQVASGALPEGVALDAATGVLAGIPSAAGTFRFQARAAAGGQGAARSFVLQVTRPALDPAAVMDQLLGAGTLPADQARFLDLLGNRNGRVDVGDVRAWLLDNKQIDLDSVPGLRDVLNAAPPPAPPATPEVKP